MFAKIVLSMISRALSGWKGYLGGVGLIALGVCGLLAHMYPELNLPVDADVDRSLEAIGLGLGVLGIRHKQGRDDQEDRKTES